MRTCERGRQPLAALADGGRCDATALASTPDFDDHFIHQVRGFAASEADGVDCVFELVGLGVTMIGREFVRLRQARGDYGSGISGDRLIRTRNVN
jgi:hypothetical protein